MYTVTNDYETYVKAEARNYSLSGTIVNTNSVTMTVTRDNILEDSFSFSKQCVNNNSFGIGSCAIGSMEITLQGDYHHSLYNAEITLQQGIWVTGDSYHMQKIGTWIIKKAVWNGEWVTLTCYDKMYLTQKKYSLSGGTYTPYALFSEACTALGITLATTQAEIEAMTNGTQTFTFNGSTQETDRKWSDVLSDMCAAICGFCTINRFGNMEVHQFGRCYKRIGTEKTYYTAAVDTLTKNDRITGGAFGNGAINITGIYINDRASKNADKSILVGNTTGTTLNLGYNRWLSSATSGYATMLQNILTQLTACQFYAADVHLADVSLYDLGDLITLQAGGELSLSEDILMCVMNIDYNFADESTISSYTFSEASDSSTSAVETNLTNRIETLESSQGDGNKIYTSKSAPDNTVGNEGDLWVKYHTENNDKFINSNDEEIDVDIPRYESDNEALSYVDTTIRPILRTIKDKNASELSAIVKQFEKECTVILYQTYFSSSVSGGAITTSQFPQLVIDTYTVNNQSVPVIQGDTIVSFPEGTTVTSRAIGSNKSAIVNVDDFDGTLVKDGGNWYVIYNYLYYNTTTKYLNVIYGYLDINWYFHTLPHDTLNTIVTNYSIDLADTSVMIIDEVYCKIGNDWVNYDGDGGSDVTVTPITTTGTNIANIAVNGTTYNLFAPSGGGGGGSVNTDIVKKYTATLTSSQYAWFTFVDEDGNTLRPKDGIPLFASALEENGQYFTGLFWRNGDEETGSYIFRIGDLNNSSLQIHTSSSTLTFYLAYMPYKIAVPETHHYSTTEQVVGTWIDNSTIYERTYDLGSDLTLQDSTWTDIGISVPTNANRCIKAEGIQSDGTSTCIMASIASTNITVQSTKNSGDSIRYLTIQYTKTS